MTIRKAVETSSGAHGVCPHFFKVKPIPDIQDFMKDGFLRDLVDTVASRSPERVLGGVTVILRALCGKNAWDRVLMIENDVGEVAIDTVIQIKHVRDLSGGGITNLSASDDVAGESVRSCYHVAARFTDDADVGWEIIIQCITEDSSDLFESFITNESTTNVESVEVKAQSSSLIEDSSGIFDSFDKSLGIRSTGSYVEADANNVEIKLLSESEQFLSGV